MSWSKYIATGVVSLCMALSCKVEPPAGSGAAFDGVLKVRDYGAVPDDGLCDIEAIRNAIADVHRKEASVLEFEEGVYDLFVGDASLNNAIEIRNIDDFTLRGAVNRRHQPSTVLLRHYDMAPNIDGKQILLVQDCFNFTAENLRFDNYPQYMASGKVYHNDGNVVGIRLFEGCYAPQESYMYCCNVWDPVTEDLKRVECVTYGSEVDASLESYKVISTGDGKVMVTSPAVASKVQVGDGISWHFGWLGLQVDFRWCDNLRLNNIESNSAIGFHIQASYCRNITATGVKIKRSGPNLCVGSRDGWKLYLCSGRVTVDDMYCEGVRWDGQNVHGKLFFVKERLNDYQMTVSYNGAAIERILPGDRIGVWTDRENETLLTVSRYECSPNSKDRTCTLWFSDKIPENVMKGDFCNVYSHVSDYTLKNSRFRNIAGCASIVRNDNTTLTGNEFYNIMYPAICIGGDLDNEGVSSRNVTIENNLIEKSSWVERNGRIGAISVAVSSADSRLVPYISDVAIRNNVISDSKVGIHLKGVKGLTLEGNTFSACQKDILKEDVIEQ